VEGGRWNAQSTLTKPEGLRRRPKCRADVVIVEGEGERERAREGGPSRRREWESEAMAYFECGVDWTLSPV